LQFANSPDEPLSGCSEHRAEEVLTDLTWRVRSILEEAKTDFESEVEKAISGEEATRVGDLLKTEGFERPRHDGPFTKGDFLTRAGVTYLVESSSRNTSRAAVVGLMRILRTSRQQTWLVVTQTDMYCILDDEKTSAGSRPNQWQIPLGAAAPIRVRPRAHKATGLVDVGPRKNWLYSQQVYPDPTALKGAVEALVATGRRT
jgi:hypothetical protein